MRIVSLLPSATEILFAIGAGRRGRWRNARVRLSAGRATDCRSSPRPRWRPSWRDPAAHRPARPRECARRIEPLSSRRGLLESLEPDLIVTQELCAGLRGFVRDRERAANGVASRDRFAIISLEPSSLEDVLANVRVLGRSPDTPAGRRCRGRSCGARRLRWPNVGRRRRPRTLVLEWTDPPMGGGHWTPGLVELAGGEPSSRIRARTRNGWTGTDRARRSGRRHRCTVRIRSRRAPGEPSRRSTRTPPGGLRAAQRPRSRWTATPISAGRGPGLVDSAEIIAGWYTAAAEHAR